MLYNTFNLIQFLPFSNLDFFHKKPPFSYIYILKKTENGLIFLDIINFSGLYSDIQIFRNDLSALDTKLDNAITGGSVVAPFSFNLLQQSYSDNGAGSYNGTGFNTISANSIHVRSGGSKASYIRTYNVVSNILSSTAKPAKFNIDFTLGGEGAAIKVYYNNIEILNASSSTNTSVNISQLVAQNKNGIIKIEVYGVHSKWIELHIKSCTITN